MYDICCRNFEFNISLARSLFLFVVSFHVCTSGWLSLPSAIRTRHWCSDGVGGFAILAHTHTHTSTRTSLCPSLSLARSVHSVEFSVWSFCIGSVVKSKFNTFTGIYCNLRDHLIRLVTLDGRVLYYFYIYTIFSLHPPAIEKQPKKWPYIFMFLFTLFYFRVETRERESVREKKSSHCVRLQRSCFFLFLLSH